MKTQAAVLYEMGRARPYADSLPLVIEDVDLAGPRRGEALVEVGGAGLCHSDLSTIDGTRPWPMPMVLGHEAAGVVREIGPDVDDLEPGDHVVFSYVPMCGRCEYCATARPALCVNGVRANRAGVLLHGGCLFTNGAGAALHHHLGVAGYARFTVAARESLIKIDPELPLEIAALFGCAILTGVGAVVNTARVEPGAGVAVFGLGGVGLSVVMGARAAGACPIIAVDSLESKLPLARDLGADYVISAANADPIAEIQELTGGGVAYAFESVGSETVLEQAYRATRRGGTTVTIGLPHPEKQFSVSASHLVADERTVKGSYMGSAVPRRDVPRMIRLYRAGLLPVDRLLTRTLPLTGINAAFDALAAGAAIRQVVTF